MNFKNIDDRLSLILPLIVLSICAIVCYFHQVGAFGVETDFYGIYAIQAENILSGKPYTYQHNPPAYCLLLALFTYFIDDTFIAGKIISILATSLYTWAVYLIISLFIDKKIALAIVFICVLTIVPYPFLASTDVLGAALILTSIWFFLRKQKSLDRQPINNYLNYILSGLIAGCAYLTRSNGIFLILGIVASLLIFNPHRQTQKQKLISAAIFIASSILIISPWLIYNWHINGSPFASTARAQIAAHFYHPEGDKLITSVNEMGEKFKSLTEVIRYDPIALITTYTQDIFFNNLPAILLPKFLVRDRVFPFYQIIILSTLILIAFGIYCLLENKNNDDRELQPKILSFLLINLFGYLILGLVGFNRRYYFFLFPCLSLLLIYPFYRYLLSKITGKIIAGFFLTSIAIVACGETYNLLASEPKYLLEMADTLKRKSLPQHTIIVRKPHLAYLAELTPAFPLVNTAEEYLKAAKEIDAKYIVYSDYEATLWQGLKSISNPQTLPREFQLVDRHSPSNTLIYQFKY
jgi:4-amino-4-deoxy-L-arabinose transferase-like glycosyltransferase